MAAATPPSEAASVPAPLPLAVPPPPYAPPPPPDAEVVAAGALLEVEELLPVVDEPPLAGPTTPPNTLAGAVTFCAFLAEAAKLAAVLEPEGLMTPTMPKGQCGAGTSWEQ